MEFSRSTLKASLRLNFALRYLKLFAILRICWFLFFNDFNGYFAEWFSVLFKGPRFLFSPKLRICVMVGLWGVLGGWLGLWKAIHYDIPLNLFGGTWDLIPHCLPSLFFWGWCWLPDNPGVGYYWCLSQCWHHVGGLCCCIATMQHPHAVCSPSCRWTTHRMVQRILAWWFGWPFPKGFSSSSRDGEAQD